MSKKRICLDPGHFGSKFNPGAVSGYYESAIVWKLTMLEKEILEKMGYEVVLTRNNINDDPDLVTRGQKAKGCALFVSNHTNAVNNAPEVNRVVVIHLLDRKDTTIDDKSKEFAIKFANTITNAMGINQSQVYSLMSDNDRDGNGIKDDNYYGVLHGGFLAGVPSIIAEHSFHTNPNTCKWLMNDSNLRKLAEACAKCMAEFVGAAEENVDANKTLYRVQTGAFRKKEYADAMLAKVKAAGFKDAYMTLASGLYRIQVGAYVKHANATNMAKKLNSAGFETYITTKSGTAVAASKLKSIDEIAKEVIQGKWGNGADRKNRLTKAGYDYSAVQKRVDELL
jgi:N-acetylmuramoyl-L-alanine amidase